MTLKYFNVYIIKFFKNLKINELRSHRRILKNSKVNLRVLKGENCIDNSYFFRLG